MLPSSCGTGLPSSSRYSYLRLLTDSLLSWLFLEICGRTILSATFRASFDEHFLIEGLQEILTYQTLCWGPKAWPRSTTLLIFQLHFSSILLPLSVSWCVLSQIVQRRKLILILETRKLEALILMALDLDKLFIIE